MYHRGTLILAVMLVLLSVYVSGCSGGGDKGSTITIENGNSGWVSITSPSPPVTVDSSPISLTGQAFVSPSVSWYDATHGVSGVAVTWKNETTGASGSPYTSVECGWFIIPLCADDWSASVPLGVGDNHITISASDKDGNWGTASITVSLTDPGVPKAITSFSFAYPAASGAINEAGKTIFVSVPNGTNVTSLIADFTTTGISVKVGSTTQVSGTTPNDFTNPVVYTVTGSDGSTAQYTVTVSNINIISGRVTDGNGVGLSGVTLYFTRSASGASTDSTDYNGEYGMYLGNGTWTITPALTGYTFVPASRTITVNSADVGGQDFTAQ